MEIFLCIVIVLMMLLLAGVEIGDIAMIILALLGVIVIFTGLFFAVCTVFVFMSKRKKGSFVEIDSKHPIAVYLIENERVKNLFPRESVMRKRLYVPEKEITILYCKAINRTIDSNALLTIIVGALVFIPTGVMMVLAFLAFFGV